MTIFERKVCMLGAAGVGKTSLVRRLVEGIFSERYHSTIGVKVDRKVVSVGHHQIAMALWDIEGETKLRSVRPRYLRGAAGYLLVADGTNPDTLHIAHDLQQRTHDRMLDLPFVLLLNKRDLGERWRVTAEALAPFHALGWTVIHTSARTGAGVAEGFTALAERLNPPAGA
jgi:small GTP-binding protein